MENAKSEYNRRRLEVCMGCAEYLAGKAESLSKGIGSAISKDFDGVPEEFRFMVIDELEDRLQLINHYLTQAEGAVANFHTLAIDKDI